MSLQYTETQVSGILSTNTTTATKKSPGNLLRAGGEEEAGRPRGGMSVGTGGQS